MTVNLLQSDPNYKNVKIREKNCKYHRCGDFDGYSGGRAHGQDAGFCDVVAISRYPNISDILCREK